MQDSGDFHRVHKKTKKVEREADTETEVEMAYRKRVIRETGFFYGIFGIVFLILYFM